LRNVGFERVVFLAFNDHDGSLPDEDRIVRDLGMDHVQIPVVWDAPSTSDFYAFAGAFSFSGGGPVRLRSMLSLNRPNRRKRHQ
jgi:hypothetical protein